MRQTLVSGAAWEEPTHAIVAALAQISSKRPKPKYKKKRVGCRAAKKLEELDNVGEQLTEEESTLFRALAARALYLSMDRPDVMYSSTELCRKFAHPTNTSIQKLKHLVRYLSTRPRLVWHFNVEVSLSSSRSSVAQTSEDASKRGVQHQVA